MKTEEKTHKQARARARERARAWSFSIYNPPYLVLKQAAMIIVYAFIARWHTRPFLHWLVQCRNLLHASAGLSQICCFGINPHVVWEVTGRCNLRCIHCHAFGGEQRYKELTTSEGKELIDRIADMHIRTFVFSGGEPLLREDLFELIEHAKERGLTVFIATNGTLITRAVARELKRYDTGVVIGLDAMNPEIHDRIRGVRGAYEAVIGGINNCTAENLYLHLNIVAARANINEIEPIIDYGDRIGVYSYFIYRFVPAGRGKELCDQELDRGELRWLLKLLLRKQREISGILIPVAAPEYWAYMLQSRGIRSRSIIALLGQLFGGCLAGRGMMYIKPNGDVWACPFIPISMGNICNEPADMIWEHLHQCGSFSPDYACHTCPYRPVCGGCKTRTTCLLQ